MTLEEALQVVGDNIITDAKSTLKRKKRYATGTLYNSLKAVVSDDELTFEMSDYAYYIDKGRNGLRNKWHKSDKNPPKGPPKKEIEEWMKLKGIEMKYSFIIRRKIREFGIMPTFFFTDAYEKNIDKLDSLLDEYVDDMMQGLEGENI